jgi:SAM-dependent methyltransferase
MIDEGTTPAKLGARNSSIWARGGFSRAYSGRELRPAEVLVLIRHRTDLAGRVLELGCGAGRITGYLVQLAGEAYGIDISSEMIRLCQERYPAGTFVEGDMLDLSAHEDGSFTAALAGFNILDVFDDHDRRLVLQEVRRVLAPGALFIMSSHNRAYLPLVRGPGRPRTVDPLRFAHDLVRAPRRIRRHRRLESLQRDEPDYAMVSDGTHEFSFVHYYVTREAQVRQLEQEGFEALECLDLEGNVLAPGETAPSCPELHYIARRR